MLNTIQYMLQGFLFLGIFGAMILIAYIALRYINKKMTISSNETIEIVSGLALSQSKGIYIVRILGAFYVIGLGDDIRLLREITDEEEIELLKKLKDSRSSTLNIKGEEFSKILSENLVRLSRGNKGEDAK